MADRFSRHSASRWVLRTAALTVASIVLGGCFGVVATYAMNMPRMADIAFMFGAIAGFACSPALTLGLKRGPLLPGLAVIILPTIAAAYLGGRFTPPNGGPVIGMAASITTYILASICWRVLTTKWYPAPPANACQQCRYDRTGLPEAAPCPECGRTSTVPLIKDP
jgi:hypothetical protein